MCKSYDKRKVHLLIAYLTLILDLASFFAAIALLATSCWDLTGDKLTDSVDEWLQGWLIVGLVTASVGIVITIVDIYGIHKSRYRFMQPFLFYSVIKAVTFGLFAVAFLVLIIVVSTKEERQEEHEQNVVRTHIALLIASGVVSGVVVALSSYSCFVVRSHMKKERFQQKTSAIILDERMKNRRCSWEVYSPVIKKLSYPDLIKINPS
ncbi:hypothetical protein FHG87_002800 [Trinorchestia longiramus]|nr:hypothetical protein FHG87_002800 [Trinorchestia longiramus]